MQPDAEHQQDHTDFSELVRQILIRHKPGGKRAEPDPPDDRRDQRCDVRHLGPCSVASRPAPRASTRDAGSGSSRMVRRRSLTDWPANENYAFWNDPGDGTHTIRRGGAGGAIADAEDDSRVDGDAG